MKHLILASTSTLHGEEYLEYLRPVIRHHFVPGKPVLFLPFARPGGITHSAYTEQARLAFERADLRLEGIDQVKDPKSAISEAGGFFVGGGNTFLLVQQLYRLDLLTPLREAILRGVPYLGTSAGTNIAGLTMQTTNDMPTVYPPSFKTLGLVPFNINPHYLDPDPGSRHKGETRETRIAEFHVFNTPPVIGLREGSWLEVSDDQIILKGDQRARIFKAGKPPVEVQPESLLHDLR